MFIFKLCNYQWCLPFYACMNQPKDIKSESRSFVTIVTTTLVNYKCLFYVLNGKRFLKLKNSSWKIPTAGIHSVYSVFQVEINVS